MTPERSSYRDGPFPCGRQSCWVALFWRWPWRCASVAVGTLLALVGFVVFTVELRTGGGTDPHANRKLYERIMQARERVEYLRDGHPVRFWYDEHDPDYSDYLALNSTYVADYSWLGPKPDFPRHGCGRTVDPGALIVVSSRNSARRRKWRGAFLPTAGARLG